MATAEKPVGKTGKPLWGAPLKVHQLEQEIARLEDALKNDPKFDEIKAYSEQVMREQMAPVQEELDALRAKNKELEAALEHEKKCRKIDFEAMTNTSELPQVGSASGVDRVRIYERCDYPLVDMWPSPPGMDPPMSKTGHQFYYGSTVKDSGEFVYFEQMDFYSDSGYNAQSLFDRIVKMAGRAIGDMKTDSGIKRRKERLGPPLIQNGKHVEEYDYSTLPEFKKGNRIEVRVRILPAS